MDFVGFSVPIGLFGIVGNRKYVYLQNLYIWIMPKVYSKTEKFPKRVDNYILYRLDDAMVLREVSGFTSKALKNSPKYENSRKNASEFGRVSSLCKKMRLLLGDVLPRRNNLAVCNSLTAVMRKAMVFDTVSERGARNLATAFLDERARNLLLGYDFNLDVCLADVVKMPYCYDMVQSQLCFGKFFAGEAVVFPEAANTVGMRLHQFRFNFEDGLGVLMSSDLVLFSDVATLDGWVLTCEVPDGKGVVFSVLEVRFYGYEDGSYVPVEEKVVCVVGIG